MYCQNTASLFAKSNLVGHVMAHVTTSFECLSTRGWVHSSRATKSLSCLTKWSRKNKITGLMCYQFVSPGVSVEPSNLAMLSHRMTWLWLHKHHYTFFTYLPKKSLFGSLKVVSVDTEKHCIINKHPTQVFSYQYILFLLNFYCWHWNNCDLFKESANKI